MHAYQNVSAKYANATFLYEISNHFIMLRRNLWIIFIQKQHYSINDIRYQIASNTLVASTTALYLDTATRSDQCSIMLSTLTHWGRVTHICVSDLTSIGSDNGLSPGRRQAIIRTNAGILSIRPLWTNFSECLVEIIIFSFKKMRLKVSSAKRRPFCLGLMSGTTRSWQVGRTMDCGVSY